MRENNDGAFTIENEKVIGKNVILCKMVMGQHNQRFIVGYYLPPSDKEGVTHRMVIDALENCPKGTCPIVIYDLNSNLDYP